MIAGFADETREAWRKISPEFEAYVVEFLAGEIWSRPHLDLQTRSLVTIATLAGLGRPLALELNIRMAIRNGATRQDITETLLQIAPYAGFPAVWDALARAAEGDENLMPLMLDAVRAYATVGEVCKALVPAFGLYREVSVI